MKVGVFQLIPGSPERDHSQLYREAIEQVEYAERLGFDSVWLGEHHFTNYGICPSILTFASYIAARTERIRIGLAVAVLPFYQPLRLAEEAAMVDVLSGGRLDFGVGRGYQRVEFDGFGVSLEESRGRFKETLEILQLAWSDGPFSYDGEFYKIDSVDVLPKPIQKPGPPIYAAAVSPETAEAMAEKGYPIMVGLTDTESAIATAHTRYRDKRREVYPGGLDLELPVLRMIYLSQDGKSIRAEAEPGFKNYLSSLITEGSPGGKTGEFSQSYGFYEKHFPRLEGLTYETAVERMLLFGEPAEIRERINGLERDIGLNSLICWFSFGLLPHEKVMRSMELMAEHVLPHLKEAPIAG
ncbi:MAG: LLM class flavin-dependent oxidoreductase [Chloroflexi bacterium]|nr:LLM class flavin-dependent oxidoreductase [Chloroflexota bacterium]